MPIEIQYTEGLTVEVIFTFDNKGEAWINDTPYIDWGDGETTCLITTSRRHSHKYDSYRDYTIEIVGKTECGTDTDSVDVTLVEPTHSITCYVKDEDGNGVPNVYVNCFVDSGRTDSNGYIRFSELEEGHYVVEIVPDDYDCIDPHECAYSFTLNTNITRNFTVREKTTSCINGEKRCKWDSSQSRYEIEKCVSGEWAHDSWCPVGAICTEGICGEAPPTRCSGKSYIECGDDPNCFWWESDSKCHDEPYEEPYEPPTTYPTLEVTSDADFIGGADIYIDEVLQTDQTPTTIDFAESDIDKTIEIVGMFAGVMKSKPATIQLKAGENTANLGILMDNKEILAGGAIAGVLLMKFV